MSKYLDLAKQAYESSSTYFDANFRTDLDYSIRAFRSEHAAGSKYLSAEYLHRSRLFRPKTRAIIRKNEAAAAAALFSNMEIIDIQAGNPDDVMSVASAQAIKQIVDYRLSRTIPAFMLTLGAFQDAMVAGAVCSYQYWQYETRDGVKKVDKPCIELRPLENLRFDNGASWIDPVNTSPYWCDIVPMYVCDVKAMMANVDDKTNAPKWKKYDDAVILRARPDVMDSTRKARDGNRQAQSEEPTGITDFDIVWVMRWFMKDSQGSDRIFYTLGTEELLTDDKPIDEVYFHGKRPYVMGCSIIETHKTLKTSLPMLTKHLQMEGTEVMNQRLDNVKFVLNKRWIVRRGAQVDTQSLVRNVPGGVTLATNPKEDVQESNWPDVTSSAYVEQDRINADFDDLAGNFSPSTKVANNAVNDTLGGSRMAAQGAGLITDYMLRTFIESWYEPVLRQLILLEQYYETDENVLAICANKARLFPRFGISRITDMMLMNEVNVTVNVGPGSSNPNERFQKFMVASKAATDLVQNAPPGMNVQEAIKEIYSNAGYRDGSRFWSQDQDPRLTQAMQMVQQLQQQLQGKQMEQQATMQLEAAKIQSGERIKSAELQVDQGRIQGDLAIRQSELVAEQQRLEVETAIRLQELEIEKLKLQLDVKLGEDEVAIKSADIDMKMREAEMKLQTENAKLQSAQVKMASDMEQAQMDLEKSRMDIIAAQQTVEAGEDAKRENQEHRKSMSDIGSEIVSLKEALSGIAGMMAQTASQPRKKPTALKLQKVDGKTRSVLVSFDDGSEEPMAVN